MTTVLVVHTSTNTPPGRYGIIIIASRGQLLSYALVYLTVYPAS
ncbi:MAG TPA: hypothetical protein VE955_09690 [Candidatus Dormibacteraeota bacterium]|nr:hypothetical protein [Candidatus Dormibacteraeota bacterium]